MKNIVQTTLLALTLLAPTTGFAMETDIPVAAPVVVDTTKKEDTICPFCHEEFTPQRSKTRITHEGTTVPHVTHTICALEWFARDAKTCLNCNVKLTEKECDLMEDQGTRMLINACAAGEKADAQKIIRKFKPNINNPRLPTTALIESVKFGHRECVALLCAQRDLDVNIKDAAGNTALDIALTRNQLSFASLLSGMRARTTWSQWREIRRWRLRNLNPIIPIAASALAAIGMAYWHQVMGQ